MVKLPVFVCALFEFRDLLPVGIDPFTIAGRNRFLVARQMPRQTGKRGAPSPNATKGASRGDCRAVSVAAVEAPAIAATTLPAQPIRSAESVGALASFSYFVRPVGKWIEAIFAIATAVVRNRHNFEHAAAGAARPSRHTKRGGSKIAYALSDQPVCLLAVPPVHLPEGGRIVRLMRYCLTTASTARVQRRRRSAVCI
eukprot:GHVS01052121.1.p1 GENE.GHVS01052121.1~~GHVS01052121.1.p1  ORF type:complete len:198 (-),score=5.09 GHVS01052121.1:98-691(-)